MSNPGKSKWARPRSILVATDLADTNRLFPVAMDIALESGAKLILLHVLTATNTITIDPNGLPFYDPTEALRFAEKSLEHYRMRAFDAGLDCSIMVREGAAAQQVVASVRQLDVDLLILGTRSHSRLGKLLLGSVADQVLRSVPAPVLTIGPEANLRGAATGQRRTVLYATTLKGASHRSAALACNLAQRNNARLVLLHIVTQSEAKTSPERTELYKRIEREMKELVPQELACSCDLDIRIAEGNPSIEILAEAVEQKVEMVVMGASQASTLQKLTKDDTIYRVISHAPCPVLTILEEEITQSERTGDLAREAMHSGL